MSARWGKHGFVALTEENFAVLAREAIALATEPGAETSAAWSIAARPQLVSKTPPSPIVVLKVEEYQEQLLDVARGVVERLKARKVEVRRARWKAGADRIYVLHGASTGLIKIGTSFQPMKRLPDLQVGSPDRLTLLVEFHGDQRVEQWLHRRFAAARSHGEWFHPTPEVLAFVAEMKRRAERGPWA